jgi:hypothetical protein
MEAHKKEIYLWLVNKALDKGLIILFLDEICPSRS